MSIGALLLLLVAMWLMWKTVRGGWKAVMLALAVILAIIVVAKQFRAPVNAIPAPVQEMTEELNKLNLTRQTPQEVREALDNIEKHHAQLSQSGRVAANHLWSIRRRIDETRHLADVMEASAQVTRKQEERAALAKHIETQYREQGTELRTSAGGVKMDELHVRYAGCTRVFSDSLAGKEYGAALTGSGFRVIICETGKGETYEVAVPQATRTGN